MSERAWWPFDVDIQEGIVVNAHVPPMEPLTIDDLNEAMDRLTTKVICHPDRAEAMRAALAAADPPLPLVRVVESPYVPDPSYAYVVRPDVDLPGLYERTDTP